MKCAVCKGPAREVIVYKREQNTDVGYLALDHGVVFDKVKIDRFLYTCEEKGLRLKAKGTLDLCETCLRDLKLVTVN